MFESIDTRTVRPKSSHGKRRHHQQQQQLPPDYVLDDKGTDLMAKHMGNDNNKNKNKVSPTADLSLANLADK